MAAASCGWSVVRTLLVLAANSLHTHLNVQWASGVFTSLLKASMLFAFISIGFGDQICK